MHRPQNRVFAPSERPPASRYYLSNDGRTSLGPFSMADVKCMIRHRHFARDVLIRAENELSWTRYRLHLSRSILWRALCNAITQLKVKKPAPCTVLNDQ